FTSASNSPFDRGRVSATKPFCDRLRKTRTNCPSLTMALSTKLDLRQSQSLVMTPQLMQAIKLLQLSSLDLVAFVEQELESNPLLERDETDQATAEPEPEPEGEIFATEPAGDSP